MYTGIIWWAFGLYVLFFARAPYVPTPSEEQAFSELMQQAIFSEDMREAQQEAMAAQRRLSEVHVWGWRWRPPYDTLVPPRQQAVNAAEGRLREALRERDALQSEAKSNVGLWSSHGIDEVRERFWRAYQDGKDFAKRMTFWDVMVSRAARRVATPSRAFRPSDGARTRFGSSASAAAAVMRSSLARSSAGSVRS